MMGCLGFVLVIYGLACILVLPILGAVLIGAGALYIIAGK